ncbi:MAG: hypothetical protein IPL59_09005 [Candidatus Competibacteraceae bacterium]|nr:hypothetical protein [Candidatus Competibacteraceae bacterium]
MKRPLLSSPLLVAAALAISLGGGTAYATPTAETQADVFITQSPNIGDTSNAVAESHDPASGTQANTSRAFAQFVDSTGYLFGSGNGVADTNGGIYARGDVVLTFGNIGVLQVDGGAETVYTETITSGGPVHAYLDFVIPTLELSAVHKPLLKFSATLSCISMGYLVLIPACFTRQHSMVLPQPHTRIKTLVALRPSPPMISHAILLLLATMPIR